MSNGDMYNEWYASKRQFNMRLTELKEKDASIYDAKLIELPKTKNEMAKWLTTNFNVE
jgi:hypothetical protein